MFVVVIVVVGDAGIVTEGRGESERASLERGAQNENTKKKKKIYM